MPFSTMFNIHTFTRDDSAVHVQRNWGSVGSKGAWITIQVPQDLRPDIRLAWASGLPVPVEFVKVKVIVIVSIVIEPCQIVDAISDEFVGGHWYDVATK